MLVFYDIRLSKYKPYRAYVVSLYYYTINNYSTLLFYYYILYYSTYLIDVSFNVHSLAIWAINRSKYIYKLIARDAISYLEIYLYSFQ